MTGLFQQVSNERDKLLLAALLLECGVGAEHVRYYCFRGEGDDRSVGVTTRGGRKYRFPIDAATTLVIRQRDLEQQEADVHRQIADHEAELRRLERRCVEIANARADLRLPTPPAA